MGVLRCCIPRATSSRRDCESAALSLRTAGFGRHLRPIDRSCFAGTVLARFRKRVLQQDHLAGVEKYACLRISKLQSG
jgi:hypothetical protein